MSYKPPTEIAKTGIETGSTKAKLSWDKALVAGFLAGAYMFFLPVAIFAGVPDLTWWDAIHNWIFAFVGNLVGATIFVAGAYWFLYVREAQEEPGDTPSGRPAVEPEAERVPVGGRA